MNNTNKNKDPFDDLIRKASGHEGFSFQEGDWDQLESMMDEDDRRIRAGWIWSGIAALLIIGVGSWSFFNYTSSTIENLSESISSNPIVKAGTDQAKVANTEPPIFKTDIKEKETEMKAQANIEEQIPKEKLVDLSIDIPVNYIDESPEETMPIEVEANEKSQSTVTEVKNKIGDPKEVKSSFSLVPGDISTPLDTEPKEEVSEPSITEDIHPKKEISDSVVSETNPETIPDARYVDSSATDTTVTDVTRKKIKTRKLSVIAGIGSDWSTASNLGIGRTKLRLQLGVEYNLLKRWSLFTAVSFVKKDYQINPEEYTVKKGFWTNGIKPSNISAKCTVIDLPLNIKYYLTPQDTRKSSFYLTVGASSYIMASEWYGFNYDVEDPTLKQEWKGKWENVHYYSILNLSGGYQKTIKNNWSVLMEPYVNVPLTGIGFGEVKLISFGLSLSIKY